MHVLAQLSITVGWLRGGHPERFGAAVLLLDYLAGNLANHWQFRDLPMYSITQDLVVMVIFGWLALRADRWWPIAVTASLALIVLVRILGMFNPDLSRFAMLSAVLGFWLLLYTVMLAGVVERRLAGEAAVSEGKTWRRRQPARPDRPAENSPEGAAPLRPS
ncbi:hypothetical protein [Brevundimonas sp.]|uniref:hypothetical protein n=1 Tax=Brevundimonas sp. TaxID=1871086 RepID=UPI002C81CFAB|nr:hypothetical protein [Brevundimonas sp.]HWQ87257.1 hypothetical protein [Brevundimonas sp.]